MTKKTLLPATTIYTYRGSTLIDLLPRQRPSFTTFMVPCSLKLKMKIFLSVLPHVIFFLVFILPIGWTIGHVALEPQWWQKPWSSASVFVHWVPRSRFFARRGRAWSHPIATIIEIYQLNGSSYNWRLCQYHPARYGWLNQASRIGRVQLITLLTYS